MKGEKEIEREKERERERERLTDYKSIMLYCLCVYDSNIDYIIYYDMYN